MKLDFKKSGKTILENFSYSMAKKLIDGQFAGLRLQFKARDFIAREMEKAGDLSGKEFNEIINKACDKNYILDKQAEEVKDIVNLPDYYNKHWK